MRSLQHILKTTRRRRTAGIDRKLGCVCQFSAQVAASWPLHGTYPAALAHCRHVMTDAAGATVISVTVCAITKKNRRYFPQTIGVNVPPSCVTLRHLMQGPVHPHGCTAHPCRITCPIHQSHHALAESNEWHAHIYHAPPAFPNGRRLLQPGISIFIGHLAQPPSCYIHTDARLHQRFLGDSIAE